MSTQATTEGKRGDPMEFLTALVFQAQGYLVRRSVPLQYGPSGADVTDIDVLGIKFTEPFQIHRIICDCKDRQRSRPYERIFWAKGLSSFTNASETYVCLPKASLEIVKFARRAQVRVLTEESLKNAAGRAKAYGLANPAFVGQLEPSIRAGLKKSKQALAILAQTRQLYLADDPYVALNIAMVNLKLAAENLRGIRGTDGELYDVWRLITGELLVLVPLFLLGIASDTLGLAKEQRRKHIVERLKYGDLPPQKAEELFDLAKQVAQEASRATNPGLPLTAPLPFDLGKVEAPEYSEDVAGLVERAIAQPGLYLTLPHVMDYLVFEQGIQRAAFAEDEYRAAFPGPLQEERLKTARNIFSFARDAGGLDLKVFWPRQEGYMPKSNAPNDAGAHLETVREEQKPG
jgi:hypothetical protein